MTMAKLFYVMGASGVGKDSLLKYVRDNIAEDISLVFAHRYITRPYDAGGENHIALSEREFSERHRQACFSMSWQSHGNSYGIGNEINTWLKSGLNVVVNGSRSYFPQAAQQYNNIIPILVCADKAHLEARLTKRGRETPLQIQKRLHQSDMYQHPIKHPELVHIHNNGTVAEAGHALREVFTSTYTQCEVT